MTGRTRPARWIMFVIRGALRAYPRRFRDVFAGAILDDFAERYATTTVVEAGWGWWAGLKTAVVAASGIVVAGLAERLHSSLERPHSQPTPRGRKSGVGTMSGIGSDLRAALRSVGKRPFFTAVVVATLGVGIGVNGAIYSLVSGVLWTRLPYPEPERLVTVWASNSARGYNRWGVSLHDFEDWRVRSDVFEDLAAYNVNSLNLTVGDSPIRATYAQVTPSLFTTLRTRPMLGRLFQTEDNLPGQDNVVIVSHGMWRDMFGSRPDAVGSTVIVDGRAMTVVGVMPPRFAFPFFGVQLWKPFGMLAVEEGSRSGRWVRAVARLKEGRSLEEAQASLDVLGAALAAEYPETNEGFGIYIEPLIETTVSGVSTVLLVLWGTTGLLLLIVCANVANMMLARATVRSRETAVRAALGASRWRLARHVLLEAVPLALLGGLLGIVIAAVGLRWLPYMIGSQIPRLSEVQIDPGVMAYSLAIALAVGIAFAVLPARRAAGAVLGEALRDGSRGSEGKGAMRLRNAMVVVQVALAMTVAIGAGLMVRSLTALLSVETGFEVQNVVSVRVAPSWSEMPERREAIDLFDEIVESLEALPSVERVSAVNTLPLSGNMWNTAVEIVGRPPINPNDRPSAANRVVLPGYHETMGIPLVRGRYLERTDLANAPDVVVINRAAAELMWPGRDPIGDQIRYDGPDAKTVVGIVGDVAVGLRAGRRPLLYVPFAQGRFGHFQNWGMSFVIRTVGPAADALPAILDRMRSVAGRVPLYSIQTMDDLVSANAATQGLYTKLLGIFAAIAFVLATLGVYGVISYLVNQRTREIGVRLALGAARLRVVRLVVRKALLLAAVGGGIGIATAALASRALAGLLYETRPVDTITYGVATLLFFAAAACASIEPAWRATRVDPVQALRNE